MMVDTMTDLISVGRYEYGLEKAIWQVYYSAIRLGCINDYSKEQVEAWAPDHYEMELWEQKIRSLDPFIAKIGSTIVGYADLQPDGKIDHFFVHGKYQGLGVGTILMETILDEAKHFKKLYSEVSMTAKPFYLHHGFSLVRVQKVDIRGVILINNLMQRVLS